MTLFQGSWAKNERHIQRLGERVTEFVQKKRDGGRLSYSIQWRDQKGTKTKSVNT